jgi:hypothetical protein
MDNLVGEAARLLIASAFLAAQSQPRVLHSVVILRIIHKGRRRSRSDGNGSGVHETKRYRRLSLAVSCCTEDFRRLISLN